MTVDLTAFLGGMAAKWKEYGNVHADALEHIWRVIGTTLNAQAGPDGSERWPVIPAELGIGKTTSAKLWCAMLPLEASALVVVRTREQAQEFADDVNAWGGRAVALFSPTPQLPNKLWQQPQQTLGIPVVVVCHKSYGDGLDEFALDTAHIRFDLVHRYRWGRRDIVIIDEALDQVAESRIARSAVHDLLRIVGRMTYLRRKDRH